MNNAGSEFFRALQCCLPAINFEVRPGFWAPGSCSLSFRFNVQMFKLGFQDFFMELLSGFFDPPDIFSVFDFLGGLFPRLE